MGSIFYLILFLPFFVSIFWAILLFLRRKTNSITQNVWIVTTLLMGVSTYIWGLYFSGIDNYAVFYKLELIEGFTTLLLLPALYFCFKSLSSEKPFKKKDLLWLLPAVVLGTSMVVLYSLMGEERATAYVQEIVENNWKSENYTSPIFRLHHLISGYIYGIVIFIQIICLLIYATVRLIRYRHQLNDFFSTLDGKSMQNHYALLAGLYLVLMLALVTYRGRFYYKDSLFIEVVMTLWAVLIYFITYNIFQLKYTAGELAKEIQQSDNKAFEQGFEITEANEQSENPANWNHVTIIRKRTEQLTQFEQLIKGKKIFLQPDLRLDDVARMMHTNRTYISRMINEEFQCTFSDYINLQRIKYAQELIRSHPDMTQEQIAEQAGFIHVSSFSRTFKQKAGSTFRDWKRNNYML